MPQTNRPLRHHILKDTVGWKECDKAVKMLSNMLINNKFKAKLGTCRTNVRFKSKVAGISP